MTSSKKLFTSILVVCFIFVFVLPVFAKSNEDKSEKTLFSLEEIQELAIKNNRNIKTLDLIIDQADKLENIYENEYDKARANSMGNYQMSRPNIEQLQDVEEGIDQYKAMGFNENINPATDLPLAHLLPLYSEADQRALFAHYMTLVLTQKMLTQKISGTEEIVEGQMSILKLLGVADNTSIVKQLRNEKENAEYTLDDLKRRKQDAEKEIEQTVTLLVLEAIKLEQNIDLLQKTYDQYLKMTNVERLKQKSGLSNSNNVDEIAIKTSNYGKQLKLAKESLHILKNKINDFIGRDNNAPLNFVQYKVLELKYPAPPYQTIINEALENTYEFEKMDREIDDLEDEIDDISGSNEKTIKRNEIEKIKLAKEEKEVEVKNYLKRILANYNEKAKAYQLSQVDLKVAKKEYSWEKMRYNSGLISKLMLTGSELKYLKVLNQELAASYEYELAKKEIELAKLGIILSDAYFNAKKQFV